MVRTTIARHRRHRRRSPADGRVDGRRLPHNTHGVHSETVFVCYPFHPLHGCELPVFVASRSTDGAVTVQDASGRRLKIPKWMVTADAAQCELSARATVDARSLLLLVELIELHGDTLPGMEVRSQEEQRHEATLVDESKHGRRRGTRRSARSEDT